MNNNVRINLCNIIKQYGISICDDPRRCKNLLKDMCPDNKLEINLLISALEAGTVVNLLNSKNMPFKATSIKLTKRVIEDTGISEENARWSIETWAEAIEVTKHSPEENLNRSPNEPRTIHSNTSIFYRFNTRKKGVINVGLSSTLDILMPRSQLVICYGHPPSHIGDGLRLIDTPDGLPIGPSEYWYPAITWGIFEKTYDLKQRPYGALFICDRKL